MIVVNETQSTPPSVKPIRWLETLKLSSTDLIRLDSGDYLTDSLMNATQTLLKKQFPHCRSLQDVTLGAPLKFVPVVQGDGPAVQILHTGW